MLTGKQGKKEADRKIIATILQYAVAFQQKDTASTYNTVHLENKANRG